MIRCAGLAGKVRTGRTGDQRHLVLLLHQVDDRQRGGRVVDLRDHIDAACVDPVARDAGRDVRLALIVGGDHLHLDVRMRGHEVLGGEAAADNRAPAVTGRIGAVEIGQHADPDRGLGAGAAGVGCDGEGPRERGAAGERDRHLYSPAGLVAVADLYQTACMLSTSHLSRTGRAVSIFSILL